MNYTQQDHVISRGNYGDLRIRAANLLRNPANTVCAVEAQIRTEAAKLLRKGARPRAEHAADVALEVMSDVIRKASAERVAEWAEANGE